MSYLKKYEVAKMTKTAGEWLKNIRNRQTLQFQPIDF